jgi:uncharacterized protein (DUF433 family)
MNWETLLDFSNPEEILIRGTRVAIEIVLDDYLNGFSPEEIAARYRTLALAQVYAVITYYLQNQTDVDSYLEDWRAHAESSWRHHRDSTTGTTKRLRQIKQARSLEKQAA